MKHAKVHDKPTDVETAEGEVLLSGPDGLAISMTPEAASETGSRLIAGAADAKGQEALGADLRRRGK